MGPGTRRSALSSRRADRGGIGIPTALARAHRPRSRRSAGIIAGMWPIRPPRWVGREEELAVLRAAADALDRGEGTVVWVEGEPGIGKSSLVTEALAVTGQPEWDVGWGG